MPTGQKPDIWSRPQFKGHSGNNDVRKKLATIDQLLDRWAGVKDGRSVQLRYDCLMALAKACEEYITRQEAKKLQKENSKFSRGPSSTLLLRIGATKTLAEQVFRRLAYEMHQYRKVFANIGQIGRVQQATGLQNLQGGYANERANFSNLKLNGNLGGQVATINPMGGSYLHAIHENTLQRQGDQQNYNQLAQTAIPQNILNLAQVNFDNLSSVEMQQLHTFFSTNALKGQQDAFNPTAFMEQVHYVRKYERLSELILIPFGGKLRNVDGSLHSSDRANVPGGITKTLKSGMTVTQHIARPEAWVMDKYGNIITKEIARARFEVNGFEVAQFNHSSLAAGNAVMCAGEIIIHEGDIYQIDNGSGHYKPTAQMLSNALAVMEQEYDLDLSKITRVFDAGTANVYASVAVFWQAVPPN